MGSRIFKARAKLRGAGLFGKQALARREALSAGQALVLEREPQNHVDRNAVKVLDFMLRPVGYVERGVAAIVAPMMDAGFVVMARTINPRIVLLWIEAPPPTKTEEATEKAMGDGWDDWKKLRKECTV